MALGMVLPTHERTGAYRASHNTLLQQGKSRYVPNLNELSWLFFFPSTIIYFSCKIAISR